MTLYRAMSYDELQEALLFGVLRPAPPSNQGKWLAASPDDAAEWGRRLWRLGNPPFHLLMVDVPDDLLACLHHNPRLDGIGPAWFAGPDDLGAITVLTERGDVPTRRPVR